MTEQLTADEEAALEALAAADPPEDADVDMPMALRGDGPVTVELGEPVEVRTRTSADVEDRVFRIHDAPGIEAVPIDDVVAVLVEQIETPPYGYDSEAAEAAQAEQEEKAREIWRTHVDVVGRNSLIDIYCDVITPALNPNGDLNGN